MECIIELSGVFCCGVIIREEQYCKVEAFCFRGDFRLVRVTIAGLLASELTWPFLNVAVAVGGSMSVS